jgi:iron complex outermembrane receptor protein
MKTLNRSSLRSLYLFAGTLGIGTALPIGTSYGQSAEPTDSTALEEIVVTAERRTADVQKTAASVSVRSGEDLMNEGKFLLKSILEDIPGVVGGAAEASGTTAGGGTDTIGSGITIRGVQSNAGGGGSIVSTAAATAVYVDGVYEGVGSGYDIDHVEVLRGPQGTLYGRSATAGVVAIHTRNPELDNVNGNAAVEFGNYNLRHYTGALNVPIVGDVLGVRVAANQYQRDGFHTDDGLGARKNTDAKIKVLYKPTETLSVLLGFALQNNEDHTGGLLATTDALNPDNVTYGDSPKGSGKNHSRQYWSEINLDLGVATLTYQPTYRTWDQDSTIIARGGPLLLAQKQYTPKDDFWTHELRLASNPGSTLTWQVGALYYDNKLKNSNSVTLLDQGIVAFAADTDKKTTAFGVFGEATYPIADSWRLTAGVRSDNTKVQTVEDYTSITGQTIHISPEEGTRKFNNWTYKLRTEHDLTRTNLVYASLSTGVSPGELTVTTCYPSGNPCAVVLDAETLTSFEVGSKNRFLDDSLQLNGSVYYYRYGGYQTAGVDVSGGNNQFATLVSPARMYGGELELLYQLTADDRLGLNAAYTKANYVDQPEEPFRFKTYIAKDDIAGVAPLTVNASYTHQWHLPGDSTLSLRVDGRYLSSHDEGTITEQQLNQGGERFVHVDGQFVGNLSSTWSLADNRLSVTGYVRNVTDNRYKTSIRVNSLGNVISGSTVTEYDVRTYGVVIGVNF